MPSNISPSLSATLISFFEQVSQKSPQILSTLNRNHNFNLESNQWHFTLNQLHQYMQKNYSDFRHIDYPDFRRLIYSCPINQTVKPYGATIDIADNQQKVDQSTYALVWLEENRDGP